MERLNWIGAEVTPEGIGLWAMMRGGVAQQHRLPPPAHQDPRAALAEALALHFPPSKGRPVLVCGLSGAGARALPCPPFDARTLRAEAGGLHLVPALMPTAPTAQITAGAALRLAGCLDAEPGFDGVICLTGPETVWAEVSAGEVVSAAVLLSGALSAALLACPRLAALGAAPLDLAAFDADLPQTISRPERLLRLLAEAAALPPAAARARLAAALIGAELAAARPWWLGRRLLVLGPDTALYARALAAQGAPATQGDAEAALLAGFAMAAREVAP